MIFKSLLSGGLIVERSFLLLLVGGLLYACFQIVAPFIPSFIWALILALSTWPYYQFISRKLGGRDKTAAVIMTLFQLMIFVIPALFALEAVSTHLPRIDAVTEPVLEWIKGPPPEWLGGIPFIGEKLAEIWREGTFSSLISAERIRSFATVTGSWILHSSASVALTAFNVLLAVLMAGFLYSHGELGASFALRFAERIGGGRCCSYTNCRSHCKSCLLRCNWYSTDSGIAIRDRLCNRWASSCSHSGTFMFFVGCFTSWNRHCLDTCGRMAPPSGPRWVSHIHGRLGRFNQRDG